MTDQPQKPQFMNPLPPPALTVADGPNNLNPIKPLAFEPISEDEWKAAKLTPTCIVEDLIFADLRLKIAAGGVGKTTVLIYEAIHVALGWYLYGRKVHKPGPVLIVSAEDDRGVMTARMREICKALDLTPDQIKTVREKVRIEYVGGDSFRLCAVRQDVVVLAPEVDHIISCAASLQPVWVIFDPAVSFGVGEQRVNDAEQGLVTAGRRIRDALDCCVEFIHHTGKANAREGAVDQYAGRGGSAMADGARMVQVLAACNGLAEITKFEKATGVKKEPSMAVVKVGLPKTTHAPLQNEFYIVRDGFRIDFVKMDSGGVSPRAKLDEEQLDQFFDLLEEAWENDEPPGSDVQAKDWVGHLVATVLEIDTAPGARKTDLLPEQAQARERCKQILAHLVTENLLTKDEVDVKGKSRKRPVMKQK